MTSSSVSARKILCVQRSAWLEVAVSKRLATTL